MSSWLAERLSWSRFLKQELQRSWSGLLASLLLHLVLCVILASLVIRLHREESLPFQLSWATQVTREPAPPPEPPPVISLPSLSSGSSPPPASQPVQQAPTPQPASARPVTAPVDVSTVLAVRPQRETNQQPESTQPQLREALDRGLNWLVRQQFADGHWSLNGPYPDGGSVETSTGATALALLALLGDGHTHRTGPYANSVSKGLNWLIQQQRPNGDLFDSAEEGREPHFYAHAQATIALCEALALTGDEGLRAPATRAVQFLVRSQNPKLGGWKYRPLSETGIGDLSVTGWVLMALHTARMAGIDPPPETFLLADRFLDSVQENPLNGGIYKYRPDFPPDSSQQLSMTATGLLCRQWLGWPKQHFEMQRGLEFIRQVKHRPEWLAERRNLYAWYYVTQVLHNVGGGHWEQWYAEISQLLLQHQQGAGAVRGSWHPYRPAGAFQERSRDGGRLYVTVLCLLILETPQRHAPIGSD
jgi:hypothetical protein